MTENIETMTVTSNVLSSREKEVLSWLIKGKSNWDIGIILGVSER
jgi:DNA-binding CsgD family transcriptional regulator